MADPRPESVGISTRTLVEGMLRTDGTIDTGELYAVAESLGMTDQQVRLCIKRLVAEGRFTHEGRGRKALLRATDDMRRLIEPEVEFVRYAFRQDRGEEPWDGLWRVVAFAVPERSRQARDALRDAVVRFGGAQVQGGLYVSPNDWEDLVRPEAERLGLLDRLTLLTTADLRIAGEDDPARLAARLWPLDEIAARHSRLIAVIRPRLARLRAAAGVTDRERLTIALELAAEFTRAMDPDPLLPPELLPHPWPGAQARALIAQAWGLLLPAEDEIAPPVWFRWYEQMVREVADPDGAFTAA